MQMFLNTVSDVYTEIPKVTQEGVFGVDTQNAVRIFQGLFGITQSGIVGPATWELLAEKYNEIENGKNRSEFQYPGDVIS